MAKKRRITPIPVPSKVPPPKDIPLVRDTASYFAPDPEPAPGPKSKGTGAVVVHHAVTFLQIVMVLGFGTWTYLTFRNADFFTTSQLTQSSPLEPYAVANQIQRISLGLRVHEALNERLPSTLNPLVDDHVLLPSDIAHPKGQQYAYTPLGDNFSLTAIEPVESGDAAPEEPGMTFE